MKQKCRMEVGGGGECRMMGRKCLVLRFHVGYKTLFVEQIMFC